MKYIRTVVPFLNISTNTDLLYLFVSGQHCCCLPSCSCAASPETQSRYSPRYAVVSWYTYLLPSLISFCLYFTNCLFSLLCLFTTSISLIWFLSLIFFLSFISFSVVCWTPDSLSLSLSFVMSDSYQLTYCYILYHSLSFSLFFFLCFLPSFLLSSLFLIPINRRCTRSCLVLLPLLGITWMFGLLRLARIGIAFDYVFTVFNSIQVSSTLEIASVFKLAREPYSYLWW